MMRCCIAGSAALWLWACAPELAQSSYEIDMPNQGRELQGVQLQGTQVQGMTMVGFQFAGATLGGAALANVRVEHGELVAEQNQVTLHGDDLVNAHLIAQVRNIGASPPTSATVEYRITAVGGEDTMLYDPTGSGGTYLYTLEQNVDGTGSWQPACKVDGESRRVAIPLAATWDEHGDRVESSSLFTFGCTTGVIAKCYRWGYRPWLTGYGDLVAAHWACTRMARADYCGNGTTHTYDGTVISLWDNLSPSGPINAHQTTPLGMLFEAGWNTGGAVCLSHGRWLLGGPVIAVGCPARLIAPGLGVLGATVCDTVAQVLGQDAGSRIFNESNLNVNLDLL
jgi:hypothetical protein